VRIGKSDANRGFVFINNGKGELTYLPQDRSGLHFSNDLRSLQFISVKDKTYLLGSQIGDTLRSYMLDK
jgi:hypothetical protein